MKRPAQRGQMSRFLTERLASLRNCTAARSALTKQSRRGSPPIFRGEKKSEGWGNLAFAQFPLPSKLSIRKLSISFEILCFNHFPISHFGKNPLKSFFLNLVLLLFPDLIYIIIRIFRSMSTII